ncbi:MAG: hypothetical protein ACI8RD_006024 [Bacillariaceae sp.]|jgi:hypothetical protein
MVAFFIATINRSCISIILLLLHFQQQVVTATSVRSVTSISLNQQQQSSERRDLQSQPQSIADLWTMNEPNLVYTESSNSNNGNKQFRLTYEVNDMIEDTMFTTTFWATTDCSSGGTPLEDEGIGYKFISTNDILSVPGDGSSVRTFQVDFEITDELNIRENQNIYSLDPDSDNGTNSRILVCVRSSLKTMNGITVNYLESIIQFRYIFENGFSIVDDIALTARDDTAIELESSSILDAYDCTDDPIGNTKSNNGNGNSNGNSNGKGKGKKQGTVLRVCVQPKNDALLGGFRMQAVENFRYETKEEVGKEKIVQEAIENRGQSKKNDLTRLQCNRGQGQCVIETLLNAAFYGQDREVLAKGTVTLQLGQDDGTETYNNNGKTSSDNGNSGNKDNPNGNNGKNGRIRHLLLQSAGRTVRSLQQAEETILQEEVNIGFLVEKYSNTATNTDDNNNKKEGLSQMNSNDWLFSFYRYHSMGASLVIILLLIFNLIVCLVHIIDYRKQQNVMKEMEIMSERLLLSSSA